MNRATVGLPALAALAGATLIAGCGSSGPAGRVAGGGGVFARLSPGPTVVPSTPGPTTSTSPPTFTLPPTTSTPTSSLAPGFVDGANLIDDTFSTDMGWPTTGDTDISYQLNSTADPSNYVISAGKGFEYFVSPDLSSQSADNKLNSNVDVKIRPSANVGATDGFGVYCRNANRMRYVFQVNHGATGSDPISWQIIRDNKGDQTVLKQGTTDPGPATYDISGACATDSAGITHLGMTVNGTAVGQAQDAKGLPGGETGIYVTAFTARPKFAAYEWTLDSATYE